MYVPLNGRRTEEKDVEKGTKSCAPSVRTKDLMPALKRIEGSATMILLLLYFVVTTAAKETRGESNTVPLSKQLSS